MVQAMMTMMIMITNDDDACLSIYIYVCVFVCVAFWMLALHTPTQLDHVHLCVLGSIGHSGEAILSILFILSGVIQM